MVTEPGQPLGSLTRALFRVGLSVMSREIGWTTPADLSVEGTPSAGGARASGDVRPAAPASSHDSPTPGDRVVE